MLWEHEPQVSVSTAFSNFPKLSRVFFFLNRSSSAVAAAIRVTLCHDIHVHNGSAENFEHDFIWWVIVLQEYFWHQVLDLDSRKRDLHLFF